MQASNPSDVGLGQPGQMSTTQDGQVTEQLYSNPSHADSAPGPRTGSEANTGQSLGSIQRTTGSNRTASHLNRGHAHSGEANSGLRPLSPTVVFAGAGLPEEFLRAMNVAHDDDEKLIKIAQPDPREQDSKLGISGSIISVTFCVPHKIKRTTNGIWTLKPRQGTSSLFDSLKYLSSNQSKWKHTLVGWTGEIDILQEHYSGNTWKATAAVAAATTPNRATAPIPIDANAPSVESHANSEIRISSAGQTRLKQKLEVAQGGSVELVWLAQEVDEQGTVTLRDQHLWRQYGDHELFTLFHYQQNQPSDGRTTKKSWRYYEKMNEAFADAIVAKYKPGDIVLIHDYQLLLLPAMLRKRVPTMYIGFFLHIPFPSYEVYRSLTMRKEVLKGVLGANMIGFQEKHYTQDFTKCCERLLGLGDTPAGVEMGGVIIPVDSFPIGINTNKTEYSAWESPGVLQEMKKLLGQHAGKKIIVGRDRLDSPRGVVQKLKAFELFLERHPGWHGKVVLIQITSPTGIKEHDAKQEEIEKSTAELVTRINGNFGSLSFSPVMHYSQYLPPDEYFALLRVADAALITSVRDGMNTTALEYILCQRDKQGPLIISEFSGTAGNLRSAMRINPWDFSGVAETINKALTMPEEGKAKAQDKLYQYVTVNNIRNWTHKLLRRLLTNLTAFELTQKTPDLDQAKLLATYYSSQRRLFLFDYDGTLTPIVRDPSAAVPSDKIIRTLKTLAADPNNAVWIISGRDQAFLDEYMGDIPALGLSAEHGSFVREPREANAPCSSTWDDLTNTFDMSWQDEAMEVFKRYTAATKGSHTERKKIAITWHYRRSDPELGSKQAELLKLDLEREIATKYEVDVMTGKANVEVRPRFVNKGEIVRRLINEYGGEASKEPDFVFCLGDDHTDEDMFRALRDSKLNDGNVFATTIGPATKQTLAKWHLTEPEEVIASLTSLTENGRSGGGIIESRL